MAGPVAKPVHVSTRPGLWIPEQFCLQTHSGTFNVLLLGLQRKLKTFFFSLGSSHHTDKNVFFQQTLFKEDWDAVATFAKAKMRSINIGYALGRWRHLIYIFQLRRPAGLYTSLTMSSWEFRLVSPPNETLSPASACHRMAASADRFNRHLADVHALFVLLVSTGETKAAVTSQTNVYFALLILFFFYPAQCFATDLKKHKVPSDLMWPIQVNNHWKLSRVELYETRQSQTRQTTKQWWKRYTTRDWSGTRRQRHHCVDE